jgi:4a-hydroxytetrahydrobiopterin dehydratase
MSATRTRAQLLAAQCRPISREPAWSDDQIRAQLGQLCSWQLRHGALERTFEFANYYQTLAFVNALAWMVHQQDHHPELLVSYNRVCVRWHTHSVQGLSENDFICAAKTDAIHQGHDG